MVFRTAFEGKVGAAGRRRNVKRRLQHQPIPAHGRRDSARQIYVGKQGVSRFAVMSGAGSMRGASTRAQREQGKSGRLHLLLRNRHWTRSSRRCFWGHRHHATHAAHTALTAHIPIVLLTRNMHSCIELAACKLLLGSMAAQGDSGQLHSRSARHFRRARANSHPPPHPLKRAPARRHHRQSAPPHTLRALQSRLSASLAEYARTSSQHEWEVHRRRGSQTPRKLMPPGTAAAAAAAAGGGHFTAYELPAASPCRRHNTQGTCGSVATGLLPHRDAAPSPYLSPALRVRAGRGPSVSSFTDSARSTCVTPLALPAWPQRTAQSPAASGVPWLTVLPALVGGPPTMAPVLLPSVPGTSQGGALPPPHPAEAHPRIEASHGLDVWSGRVSTASGSTSASLLKDLGAWVSALSHTSSPSAAASASQPSLERSTSL